MYLGGPNGNYEFVNSLIEHNLIHGTEGYNTQIKHQLSRNTSIGVPSSGTTIIRHKRLQQGDRLSLRYLGAAEPARRSLAAVGLGLLGHLPDLREPLLRESLREPVPG